MAFADAPSVMNCHLKDYTTIILPDRHIVLRFLWRKNIGHHCGPSMMVSMSCVVVIDHIIFLMRIFSLCYIWIEIKDWWFDRGYVPHDFHIWRRILSFCCNCNQIKRWLLAIWITPNPMCFKYKAKFFINDVIFSSYLMFLHHWW